MYKSPLLLLCLSIITSLSFDLYTPIIQATFCLRLGLSLLLNANMRSSIVTSVLFAFLATSASANPTPQEVENTEGKVNAMIPAAVEVAFMGTKVCIWFEQAYTLKIRDSRVLQDPESGVIRVGDAPTEPETAKRGITDVNLVHNEKRVAAELIVIGIAATAAAIKGIQLALQVGINTVENLGDWVSNFCDMYLTPQVYPNSSRADPSPRGVHQSHDG